MLCTNQIIREIGLDPEETVKELNGRYRKSWSRGIRLKLEERFRETWEEKLQKEGGKLVTYKTIKKEFKYEEYLDVLQKNEQTELTRLRVSNHFLNIETGRYKKPFVPREERLCNLCRDSIEDEFHFLCRCPDLGEIRKKYYQFGQIDGDVSNILQSLLSSVESSKTTARYIIEAKEHREKLIANHDKQPCDVKENLH